MIVLINFIDIILFLKLLIIDFLEEIVAIFNYFILY